MWLCVKQEQYIVGGLTGKQDILLSENNLQQC